MLDGSKFRDQSCPEFRGRSGAGSRNRELTQLHLIGIGVRHRLVPLHRAGLVVLDIEHDPEDAREGGPIASDARRHRVGEIVGVGVHPGGVLRFVKTQPPLSFRTGRMAP